MTARVQTIPACHRIGDCFSVFLKKVSAMFDAYDRALYARDTFERMFNMSDRELARAGLRRDELSALFTRKMGWN